MHAMELALTVANSLSPIADALVYINTTKVHPVWFPYPLAPTLHAARISIIFQTNARRSSSPLSWGTYLTGFIIMSWGGGLLSHFFLGLPPPMLYSFHPSINYVSVHIIFTVLFSFFPDLLNPQVLDTILWPLDALLRTNAITFTLDLLSSPHVHPQYSNSAFTHLLIGAIVSSGGGLLAGTLSAWTPNWEFTTPPVLRANAGWSGTLDVWGGAIVALIYSSFKGHQAFASLHTLTTIILTSPLLSTTRKPHADSYYPPLTSLQAKSIATAAIALLFAIRVIKVHWLPQDHQAPSPKPVVLSKRPRKKTH